MELFNSLFNFFVDKTRGISHKFIFIVFALSVIILIDNTFSFSYYVNTNNKIEQVEKINKIIKKDTLPSIEKKRLQLLRSQIINRKTWKDKTWEFLSNFEFKNEKVNEPEKPKIIIERNYLWHFISSSWFFLFIMLIFPFASLFDKNTKFSETLIALIVIEPIFYGISWLFAKIFSYIPLILNKPIYNYIINAVLLGIFLVIFAGILNKTEKTTANKKYT